MLLLSHGRALYSGLGGFAPTTHFSSLGIPFHEGYNVADYLLEIASDPPVSLFPAMPSTHVPDTPASNDIATKKRDNGEDSPNALEKGDAAESDIRELASSGVNKDASGYATTFLTQLEALSGREWKILRRCVPICARHLR